MIKEYVNLIIAAVALVVMAAVGWGIYGAGKLQTENDVLKKQIALQAEISDLQQKHRQDVEATAKELRSKQAELEQAQEKLKAKPQIVTKFVSRETQCKIPKGFVDLHNGSARGVIPDPVNPDQPTEITLTQVAETVASNYIIHQQTAAKLEALQQLVRQYQERLKEAP